MQRGASSLLTAGSSFLWQERRSGVMETIQDRRPSTSRSAFITIYIRLDLILYAFKYKSIRFYLQFRS